MERDRGKMSRPSFHPHEIMPQKLLPKSHDKSINLYADVTGAFSLFYMYETENFGHSTCCENFHTRLCQL